MKSIKTTWKGCTACEPRYVKENNSLWDEVLHLSMCLNCFTFKSMFNLEYCVFCSIVELGDNFVVIDANGYTYRTTMDQMIIMH